MQHHKIRLKDFRNRASQQTFQTHQLVIHSEVVFFFLFLFFFFLSLGFFHEHSQFTGQQGKREGLYLTPLKNFHPLHRHLDISRAITVGSYSSYCSQAVLALWYSGYHFSQLHSTKPELRFSTGSKSAHGVFEIHDGEDL